jgi:hypothetical protein
MTTATEPATAQTYRLLIDGDWRDASSGRTFERRRPASGELVALGRHARPLRLSCMGERT